MAKNERIVIESVDTLMNNRRRPRSSWRRADIFLGLAFLAVPVIRQWDHLIITIIGAVIGVVFIIVQRIVSKDPKTYADEESPAGRKRACMIIRITALVILLFELSVTFGAFGSSRAVYPLKKALYCFGNKVDSEQLGFMPGSLPKGIKDLQMNFITPKKFDESTAHINICFYADEDALDEIKSSINDNSGELCDEDSFAYKKLKVFCEKEGLDMKGAQVYLTGNTGSHCPAYLISEMTGLCVIYW